MTFQASLVSQMVKNLSAMQETQPLISLWACAWPSTSRLGTDHGQAMMPLKWKAGKSVKSTWAPYITLHGSVFGVKWRKFKMRVCVLVSWSRLTLSDPMDCSPPGSSVHGTSQARVLEWKCMHMLTTISTNVIMWTTNEIVSFSDPVPGTGRVRMLQREARVSALPQVVHQNWGCGGLQGKSQGEWAPGMLEP